MERLSKLDYEIIDETAYEEEFFVLIGGFAQEYGLDSLVGSLVRLVNSGLITCYAGDTHRKTIAREELEEYINKRKLANENLDEYPEVCEEYRFVATDKGIEQLSDDDKPIVN